MLVTQKCPFNKERDPNCFLRASLWKIPHTSRLTNRYVQIIPLKKMKHGTAKQEEIVLGVNCFHCIVGKSYRAQKMSAIVGMYNFKYAKKFPVLE